MDRQSLPRFIETQDGEFVAVAHVLVLRVLDYEEWASVIAVMGPEVDCCLGKYGTEAIAHAALASIMEQIHNEEQQSAFAPRRDFRTAEVGE